MIYYARRKQEDVADNLDWLHPSERRVLEDFRFEKRRNDWLLGRWTAKNLVKNAWLPDADLSKLEIRSSDSRAPFVYYINKALPFTISISHGHGWAFCVTSQGNIHLGCDLEQIEVRSKNFLSDYFLPEEHHLVESLPFQNQISYSICWSAKESVMKALRLGMSLHPQKIQITCIEFIDEGWAMVGAMTKEDGIKYYGRWKKDGKLVFVFLSDKNDQPYKPI